MIKDSRKRIQKRESSSRKNSRRKNIQYAED